MGKGLISLTDYRDQKIAYADQAIFSNNYPVHEIFISAYCYESALNYLKPSDKTVRNTSSGADTIKFNGQNGLVYKLDHIPDKKHVFTKLLRIPNSEIVKFVSIINTDNVDRTLYKYADSTTHNQVLFFKLKPFLNFYRNQSNEPDSDIEKDLGFGRSKLRNCLMEYPGFCKEVYKLIKNCTDIPFLEEWVSFVLNDGKNSIGIFPCNAMYADIDNEENIYAVKVTLNESQILKTVQQGLFSGQISVNNAHNSSERTRSITSLTQYLEEYKDQLIDKATKKFVPYYNPAKDKFSQKEKDFFEYASYFGKLNYYNTQKNVIAAVNRSLDHEKNAFVCGEMGTGKTALAVGSVYCNAKSKHANSIIMAPGHLVYKWKREIERLFPDAKAVVIEDFQNVLNIEKEVKCALRNYPLFIIISKDCAKISYQERPAAIWNPVKKSFCCPTCGSPVKVTVRSEGNKTDIIDHIRIKDAITLFLNKNNTNSICITKRRTNAKARLHRQGLKEYVKNHWITSDSCHSSLWTCTNSKENPAFYSSNWVKYTGLGWLNTGMFEEYKRWFETNPINSSNKKNKTYIKIYNAILDIEENGIPRQAQPKRYSIAKFIKNRFKGHIDYLIADEVHLYSSDSSAQANAFGDFVKCAKKTIVLTGTLLNGYADGLYYILYRMYSREFSKLEYPYNSTNRFIDKYGVKKITTVTPLDRWGHPILKETKKSSKICPGVSPQLFTDFLLDKAIFVSLEDMSTGLPPYQEHPIAVRLDQCVEDKYKKATEKLKQIFLSKDVDNKDVAFVATQRLSLYPDMPYGVAPLYSKDGNIVLEFEDAVEKPENFISNKDRKTLEIVKEKIDKGENVLIYVNFVNKTDVVKRLTNLFKEEKIKACVLDAKVKSADRENWINQKIKDGYRVMISNPALVETGLDLLAFTNIIFYQTGFNLFTMRQAARRSYRLNQPNPVNVYFLYYENTTQEMAISLMANKLKAAMAIEGKFTEEGLNAMGNNDSILTQIADSLVKDIKFKVNTEDFSAGICRPENDDGSRFKLVEMIKEFAHKDPYKLFVPRKRLEKINLRSLCA